MQYKLKNGLSMLIYPMPNTHSITLGLYVKAGVGYGDEPVQGITHLLEHLHFRRMDTLSQSDLYYKMEMLGSTLRAATYSDYMKFTMKVVPDNLDGAIDIFCNLFNAFHWSAEDYEKEKQVVINQILEKEMYFPSKQIIRECVFGYHPLADTIMGSVNAVNSIPVEMVQKYKKEVFSASGLLLCITGNIHDNDCMRVMDKLQTISISENEKEKTIKYPEIFHQRKPKVKIINIPEVDMLEVNLSFDAAFDKDTKDLLTLLNCILGGGVGSRLQKVIREEKGYTSDIYSDIEWYREFAILHISFSVHRNRFIDCFESVIDVLKEMKTSITSYDLDVSLPFYTKNQAFYEDDTEGMNEKLAYHQHILGETFEKMKLKNDSTTIARLHQYAKNLFLPQNACLVIIGEKKNFKKRELKKTLNYLLNS